MSLILQTLADGLVLGGIYALAAVGFSLIFGVLHVINLSHGILVLMGAYLALIFSEHLHIDPLLTIPPVMAVLFCVGYVYQRLLIQRALDRLGQLHAAHLRRGADAAERHDLAVLAPYE